MLSTYLNITVIAEWCSLFAALFFLNKKTGLWQFFIPLMLYTICTEAIGWYKSNILKEINNAPPFNFLRIISISFFIWMLSHAEPLIKHKRALNITLLFFIVFALINLSFFQGLKIYNSYTEATGDILLAVITCYFFYAVLNEETYRNLFHYEYFWLSIGLLFSSLGNVVLYIFLDSLLIFYRKTNINVFGYVNYCVNVLFYGNLIVAFICRRKNTK